MMAWLQAVTGAPELLLSVLDAAIKGTVLLSLIGFWLTLRRRRASAGARHLVLTAGVLGLGALQVMALMLPGWRVSLDLGVMEPAPVMPPAFIGSDEAGGFVSLIPEPRAASTIVEFQNPAGVWLLALTAVWLGGAAVIWLRLGLGLLGLGLLTRRAAPARGMWQGLMDRERRRLGIRRPVRLVLGSELEMPQTWGWRRPVVLLPEASRLWSDRRRQTVITHELAHIRRNDFLIHILTEVVGGLYWFNPVVWWALRRMRIERERACDDLAVRCGFRPEDYAEELLGVARAMRRSAWVGSASVAMASPSGLEGRVRAILAAGRARAAPTRRFLMTMVLLVAALVTPAAAWHGFAPGPWDRPALRTVDRVIQINPQAPWLATGWSGPLDTGSGRIEHRGAATRFVVDEPLRRKVWICEFPWTIDPQRYPVLVMRYMARNTLSPEDSTNEPYAIWLADGFQTLGGGLKVATTHDLIADGQEHELRVDVLAMSPVGPLQRVAMGLMSGREGHAVLEVRELRFESRGGVEADAGVATRRSVVRVRVVDEQGRPTPDAEITLDAEVLNAASRTITDAQGAATVIGQYRPEAAQRSVTVTAPGMVPARVLIPGKLPRTVVEVRLERAAIYRGHVVDVQERPIAGAMVRFNADRSERAPCWPRYLQAVAVTDAEGRFQTQPLPTGIADITVQFSHPNHQDDRLQNRWRPVSSDMLSGSGQRMVMLPGESLTGRVVDEAGEPVPHAGVTIRRAVGQRVMTYADAAGRFRFDQYPPGPATLRASAPDFAPTDAAVVVGWDNREVQVQLDPSLPLRVQVVDADGRPIPKAAVYVGQYLNRYLFSTAGPVDPEGRFVWDAARAGAMTLRVDAPGSGAMTKRWVYRGEPMKVVFRPDGSRHPSPMAED